MSRAFNAAAQQYLLGAAPSLSGYPFTLAAWVRTDDLVSKQAILFVGQELIGSHRVQLSGAGNTAQARSRNSSGGDALASSAAAYTANTWHHVCGVFGAADARSIFLDGVAKGTNATSIAFESTDRVAIGIEARNSLADPFSGLIAEAAIWNAALNDGDVAQLASGDAPELVHPNVLIHYWRLIHDDADSVGGLDLTAVGGPTFSSEHPILRYAPPRTWAAWRKLARIAAPVAGEM